jgi:hypothetical protein
MYCRYRWHYLYIIVLKTLITIIVSVGTIGNINQKVLKEIYSTFQYLHKILIFLAKLAIKGFILNPGVPAALQH